MIDDAQGLDTSGVAGTDGFGLRAKPGGRALLQTGVESSRLDPMLQFGHYTDLLRHHLEKQLSRVDELRAAEYNAVLCIWIDSNGRIHRCELSRSSGDTTVDRVLRDALSGSSCEAPEPPPPGMPQPVTIRVNYSQA